MFKTVCWYWCLSLCWYSRMRLRRVHLTHASFITVKDGKQWWLPKFFPRNDVSFSLWWHWRKHVTQSIFKWDGEVKPTVSRSAQGPALMTETVTGTDAMGLNFPIDILPNTSSINLGLFWGPDSLLCVKALWMCEGFSPAKFLVPDTWLYFHLCPVMFVKQWMICF